MNRDQARLVPQVDSVTIAVDTAVSGVIDQTKGSLAGILFPSTFDGTVITFTGCDTSDGTFVAVIGSDGNALSYTVAASKLLALTDAQQKQFMGIPYLKVIPSTTQTTTASILKVLKRAFS